jgi:hypothetical protein
MTTVTHKLIGAIIRATNRTHGLTPALAWGKEETVAAVDPYDNTVRTTDGNTYLAAGYQIMRYAGVAVPTPAVAM